MPFIFERCRRLDPQLALGCDSVPAPVTSAGMLEGIPKGLRICSVFECRFDILSFIALQIWMENFQ